MKKPVKSQIKNKDELARLKLMYKYELKEFSRQRRLICGIDEAGRGPLAGPVVAGAVILPLLYGEDDFRRWEGLNDSKKVSARRREKLFKRLIDYPHVYIGIGIVSEQVIDRKNILKATQIAMSRAVGNLNIKPDCLLIDGMHLPGVDYPQKKIINGDGQSLSIAAASIIAKVTRDHIMCQYHEEYPAYAFDKHKGYGTREHFNRIRQYGPCKIHRRSFRPINLMDEIGYQ